jgi:hypothetical protein
VFHKKFDRARSMLILAFAPDQFFDAHNDVFHGRVRERAFIRDVTHDWEQHVIATFFPPPPARVLVGGAGMGREAFALAARGYSVVAFDRVPELVQGMRAVRGNAAVEVRQGLYQDLPYLQGENGDRIDLRTEQPFDAAVIGWGSFSNLLSDAARVETLRRFAEVTRGPVLASFYATFWEPADAPESGGRIRKWLRGRALRRGRARFLIGSGFNRLLTAEDAERVAKEAGLSVLDLQCRRDAQPYIVVSAPRRDSSS